jgi:tRNA A-37 threonylcarbamoyl transferase component Bud32
LKELSSPPLAEGRTAEIYLWDEQHVLKLYRDWCPPDWVEYEARVAGAIYEAGVPSPATGEFVEVNGRHGLIYERIQGVSMLQDMNAHPWTIWKHARSLAELQVQINHKSITGLPSYKDRLSYDIRNTAHLSTDLRAKILERLEVLPDGKNVCHGDYHPGNVILTESGSVAIDWMAASAGSPWADVARTSLILNIGAKRAGRQVNPIIRAAIRLYHQIYLNRYHALCPDAKNEMNNWLPVVAAARLNENILPEREALINMVQEGLNQ